MKLTPQQAIEQGYTHFIEQDGEQSHLLQGLVNGDYYFATTSKVYLCSNPYPFSISADTIHDLLSRHLQDQDEVYDEDDVLDDELAKADFEAIEKLVNVGFTARWMNATDIELDLSELIKVEDKE